MKTSRKKIESVAAGAFLMSILWIAQNAPAEVVYTPVNITITGSGSIKIDLNHDRIKDFVLQTTIQPVGCEFGGGFAVYTAITPKNGAGVVVSQGQALLGGGVSIDSSQTFSNTKAAIMGVRSCNEFIKQAFGYLGLEIHLSGQPYYGWAAVGVKAFFNGRAISVTTELTDFAYETIPGLAIKTGQTAGNSSEAGPTPASINPIDLGIGSQLVAQNHEVSKTEALSLNPVPLINQPLLPDTAVPTGLGFTLTVTGTGFVSGSVVNWNGTTRTTTYVSSSLLQAKVLAADIRKAHTASITVVNPSPGGGASNVVFFPVRFPSSSVAVKESRFGKTGDYAFVAAGDFNGDGKVDLAVANRTNQTGNLGILLGNGDGTFASQVDYPTGAYSEQVVVGDFNNDGKPDLAVANSAEYGGTQGISVLLGNGDGTFQNATNYAAGSYPVGVAVGDFNADGKLDLAVTNSAVAGGTPNVSILLGNGDGTFKTAMNFAAGVQPIGVAVGDFNRDGRLDLAVANEESTNVSILLGKGDGTFQAPINYGVAPNPFAVVTGDFNGDGKLDLAVTNISGDYQVGPGVNVLLGNGDGTFQSAVNYSLLTQPLWMSVADFNGDGSLDVAVATGAGISMFFGKGDGTFKVANYSSQVQSFSVAPGDFNGDGRLDVAIPNYFYGGPTGAVAVLQQKSFPVQLKPFGAIYPAQKVGTTSPPKTFTLTNGQTVALNNIVISTTGDFAVSSTTCTTSLAPKGTCNINVVFTPAAMGNRPGKLNVSDDAPNSPQVSILRGTGT